jgi:outer membrane protein assembly factor BamD (BamD/ComL family)
MIARLLCLFALVWITGCASFNRPFGSLTGFTDPKNEEDVRATLPIAADDFAAGRTERALDRAVACRKATGLPPELRAEVEARVEQYADRRIQELSGKDGDPDELEDMLSLDLPRQLAVRAGVAGAELLLADDEPFDAYELLKKVDTKFPNHHERQRAGELLVEGGLKLANDDWSFFGWFKTSDDGATILEYLVENYPSEKRCDEAYAKLAELYANGREWETARERCEDLLLYQPASPLAERAEALVPRYRLRGLKSPEYDRRELLSARSELEAWLERHAAKTDAPSELERDVRVDYADCLTRLTRSDLGIAHFYTRTGERYGAVLHAERALEEARATADAKLITEASAAADVARALPTDAERER